MTRARATRPYQRGTAPNPNNPLSERIMIDRELRWMLERDGYDLHDLADRLVEQDYGYEEMGSNVKIGFVEAGDNVFELVKGGSDPPVMSSSALIGTACYRGDGLFVWQLLPQTLCAGVVGLRLGDVVSTGVLRLDHRLILAAIPCTEDRWAPRAATRFAVAPDLIELAPRAAENDGSGSGVVAGV